MTASKKALPAPAKERPAQNIISRALIQQQDGFDEAQIINAIQKITGCPPIAYNLHPPDAIAFITGKGQKFTLTLQELKQALQK